MNESNIRFEESLTRLEQIVRLMEKGEASLDESIQLFREGTDLVRTCEKLLDEAELEVKKVISDGSGRPHEEVFAQDADV